MQDARVKHIFERVHIMVFSYVKSLTQTSLNCVRLIMEDISIGNFKYVEKLQGEGFSRYTPVGESVLSHNSFMPIVECSEENRNGVPCVLLRFSLTTGVKIMLYLILTVALGMELLIGGMFLKSGYVTPFPLMIPILIASFIVVITKAGLWISARAICRAIVGDLSQ